jgi:hypothetical protein
MCIGPCVFVINEEEEEEPTRCYLMFYCTCDRLNMFRAALCPSSGAHDYIPDYHMDRPILKVADCWRFGAGSSLQSGHLASQTAPNRQPSAT